MWRFLVHVDSGGNMLSLPIFRDRKSAAVWKNVLTSSRFLPLKKSGLAVMSVSMKRTLSLRVRHPAASIRLLVSCKYDFTGFTIWKLYLLRVVSTSGLLAYFSLVRSWWASKAPAPPFCLANRIMAYWGMVSLLPVLSKS